MSETTDIERYVPEIVPNRHMTYAKFLIEIHKCSVCGAFVTPTPARWSFVNAGDPFPRYHRIGFVAQAKAAGIKVGRNRFNDQTLCLDCAAQKRGTFKCALCGQERASSDVRESIGDPPEHLCEPCYQTAPAAKWDEVTERLKEEHCHDFD